MTASLARSARLLRNASDDRLVDLVHSGSGPACEAIYERYHREILSFSRHMLGSHEEGEDAVQHTFMSAFAALRASDAPIRLRPWLFTIARNRCLSTLRARAARPTGEPIEIATAGLAEEALWREEVRDVLADLARLPADQRAALLLGEMGALSRAEIAEVLGVRPERVSALVFRARESLGASRRARDLDCREIRAQLATLSGAALRRAPLRRHLALCEGCRDFKAAVARQRAAISVVLPVVPTAALKPAALSGVASAVASGSSGMAVKLAATGAIALTAAGGAVVVVDDSHHRHLPRELGGARQQARVAPAAPIAVAQLPPRSRTPVVRFRATRATSTQAPLHAGRDTVAARWHVGRASDPPTRVVQGPPTTPSPGPPRSGTPMPHPPGPTVRSSPAPAPVTPAPVPAPGTPPQRKPKPPKPKPAPPKPDPKGKPPKPKPAPPKPDPKPKPAPPKPDPKAKPPKPKPAPPKPDPKAKPPKPTPKAAAPDPVAP